ncbi:uncharacterized protein EDB93DRAFT_1103681 [Suillus bovinus]|uniref:uncharacterized protein n=1 Tax=Suillus bovinus TaxID=48563 RepID=UPI001B86E37C|nr:uncharacterized protein EDB93DRAFT_1103681 [Suillus bovinus]KAG2149123.1 hypothetical protein EDB93DRAFT_1103681 [Suillus bovinus]
MSLPNLNICQWINFRLKIQRQALRRPQQYKHCHTLLIVKAAVLSSGLALARPSQGGSSFKRKTRDALESAAKKFKMNPDDADVDGDLDVTVQTASLGVNYLLNIVIDNVMWIWYWDRQGIIECSSINFTQDLPSFMMLLYALQRFTLHDWGRKMDFFSVQAEGKRCHEFKIKDEKLGEVDLLLHTSHDKRVTHYGLQGRATDVVLVISEALTKKYRNFRDGMVAKILWGEANCTSEPEIINKVKEIGKVHDTVKDHIHELLWHHQSMNPTSIIREALGVPEPTTGSRVLYIILFHKLLTITKLHGKELFDAWHQCILCHLTLWKEGVCHRDVSPGNLMWYWKDGRRIGLLNDYDLSSLADDPGYQGNEHPGTVPFMAHELLAEDGQQGKVKHLYRYDLESFIKGVLLPRRLRPFDEWATSSAIVCDQVTWEFLMDCFVVLKMDADNRYYLRFKRPFVDSQYK